MNPLHLGRLIMFAMQTLLPASRLGLAEIISIMGPSDSRFRMTPGSKTRKQTDPLEPPLAPGRWRSTGELTSASLEAEVSRSTSSTRLTFEGNRDQAEQ